MDSARWVYPVAAVQSRHVVVLAQQRTLHSHPGTVRCGERGLALAGARREDLTAAELYSCFPSALQSFALDLGLDGLCPLTVTGAMPFAGGPFNHFSLAGAARMADVLRGGTGRTVSPRRLGLVSNLSGIFGKQACAVFSNLPNPSGYGYEDVTGTVAEQDRPIRVDESYVGPGTIVGYTVVFNRETPAHAIAICDTADSARTVVRTEDKALLESMIREEFCGRVAQISRAGTFTCRAADGAQATS